MNTSSPRPSDSLPEKFPVETFQALVENGFDVVAVVDPDGNLRYISPSVRYVLGYSQEERIGKSGLEFVHPEDRPGAISQLKAVSAKPGARAYRQFRLRHRDGSWRTVEAMAQNLSENKLIEGTVINYRDVTERMKAIEALRICEIRFHKAFSASPDAIAINYIRSGRFLEVNPAFERITGYSHDDAIGRSAIDLALWKDASLRRKFLDLLEATGHVRDFEAEFIDRHGDEKTCIVSAEKIDLAGEPCMLSVTRDVTLEKQTAIQLKQAGDELRSEHRELAEKSAALRQILDHLDRERASYRHDVASAAKSLLTPIVDKLRETGGHLNPRWIERLEDAVHRIIGDEVDDREHNMSKLTGREIDICELIRKGLTSKEIAEKLGISAQTVHKHRRTIRRKLQLDNKGINLAAYLRTG